jgi:hypothetical protein
MKEVSDVFVDITDYDGMGNYHRFPKIKKRENLVLTIKKKNSKLIKKKSDDRYL